MLLDEELEAHDRREAKRKLTKPYTNEFVAAYVANDPHPTQLGALKAWGDAGHGSQRRNWVCAAFDKSMGLAKPGRGRPPGNSRRK